MGTKIFFVNFSCIEIKSHLIRGYSATATPKMRIEYFVSRIGKLLIYPMIQSDRLLRRMNFTVLICSSSIGQMNNCRRAVKRSPSQFKLGEIFPRLHLIPTKNTSCRREREVIASPYNSIFTYSLKFQKIFFRWGDKNPNRMASYLMHGSLIFQRLDSTVLSSVVVRHSLRYILRIFCSY